MSAIEGSVKMPFGIHKGRKLSDLPDNYIEWLTTITLREPLRSAIEQELYVRDRLTHYKPSLTKAPDDIPLLGQIIDCGYRALARTCHPVLGAT